MNEVEYAHSLCDAISGLASQANDILVTVGALVAFALDHKELDANLDAKLQRLREDYAVQLAQAEARAESLQRSLEVLAVRRQELEAGCASLSGRGRARG